MNCSCGTSKLDVKTETDFIECSEHPLCISQKKVITTCNKCSKKTINYTTCKGCPTCNKKSFNNIPIPKFNDVLMDIDLTPKYFGHNIDIVRYKDELKFEKMIYPIKDNIPKYLKNEIGKSDMSFMTNVKFTPTSF